jgi:mono/diheme cytochrome c family protein
MNVESARRGRYLAAVTCIECHSPELPMGMADKPYDVSKAFSGGREYTATINMMSRKVYSSNVTPDGTGIAGWTAADIVKVLKMGLDKMGGRTCTPMGTYPAMKDEDATDIANYLLALPAKMNQIPQQCAAM